MLLLVGLGNPGSKYARHRHNVGFMAVDAIADKRGFGAARKKFDGDVREGELPCKEGSIKALALKPATYMNESGRSVAAAMRFYKLSPDDVFVFHDELDLKPGVVRMKTGGGNAGHNGLRSITDHIGPAFHRVRIGIGHPGDKSRVHGHVLGDFAKSDAAWLTDALDALATASPAICDGDAAYANAVGLALRPPRPAPEPARGRTRTKDAQPNNPARDAADGGGDKLSPEVRNDKKGDGNPFADALKKLVSKED